MDRHTWSGRMDRRTNTETERQRDREIGGQPDEHTDKQTSRQMGRQARKHRWQYTAAKAPAMLEQKGCNTLGPQISLTTHL